MDDAAVIRLVRNKHPGAFKILVERYHKNLLSFIYRLVRDPHRVEDIGQEVFLSVYKSLDAFDLEAGTPFSAWLFIIARNRCISELRRGEKVDRITPEAMERISWKGPDAEEILIREEESQLLADALSQLPESFRIPLQKSLTGVPLSDIARECGIPPATVKTRLFRARERIKRLFFAKIGGVGHEPRI